ncbi:MAG: hypothetical protein BWX66_01826 [Deltaproteobacteria bacterium ADurb.Bin058]|nr:MAG: hypothetical protein BWX66_01826 [Deltaproteobacteria bacterium ADurb.Bin058]
MEGHPKENDHQENKSQGHETLLFDFPGHRFLSFILVMLNTRIWQHFFEDNKGRQGHQHCRRRNRKGEVITNGKGIKVLSDKSCKVRDLRPGDSVSQFLQFSDIVSIACHKLMTQSWKVRVILQAVLAQIPSSNAAGSVWCKNGPDVDSHVKKRERRVSQMTVLGVVIHLAHNCLQIAFEHAVTKCNRKQAHQSYWQAHAWNRHQDITQEHGDNTSKNDMLVFASPVCDEPTY